jgi:hypothetical protein
MMTDPTILTSILLHRTAFSNVMVSHLQTRTELRGLSLRVNNTDLLSDRRLSAKLVPTLANRGCRVVSAIPPQSLIFGFLDQSRYFLEIAPQISPRG